MLRLMSFALAAALFASPVLAVDAPTGPITIKGTKQANITFNHSNHKSVKCTVCHGEAGHGKIADFDGNMKAGHATCLECHKADASHKAPTKCTECHKKA